MSGILALLCMWGSASGDPLMLGHYGIIDQIRVWALISDLQMLMQLMHKSKSTSHKSLKLGLRKTSGLEAWHQTMEMFKTGKVEMKLQLCIRPTRVLTSTLQMCVCVCVLVCMCSPLSTSCAQSSLTLKTFTWNSECINEYLQAQIHTHTDTVCALCTCSCAVLIYTLVRQGTLISSHSSLDPF